MFFASLDEFGGGGLLMEQSRIEPFLDHGWGLIGRLHHWLSKWPCAADDQDTTIDVIRGLQSFWASCDDFGLSRLARTSLALEQLLERFCAQTLEFTSERLCDVTSGVASLQELLLGFEATRAEPEFENVRTVLRLERHAQQAIWSPPNSKVCDSIHQTAESPLTLVSSNTPIIDSDIAPTLSIVTTATAMETEIAIQEKPFDQTLLAMLEEFVVKIDDTCHMLHVRMIAEDAPYVSTTSRLEHLSRSTRELVREIAHGANAIESTPIEDSIELPTIHAFSAPLLVTEAVTESQTKANGSHLLLESVSIIGEAIPPEIAPPTIQPVIHEPVVVESNTRPKRVLIVEESLFYRQLIGMAVQSAGFEPCTAETVAQGIDFLKQSCDFKAILIGTLINTEFSQAMDRSRIIYGAKVIGLLASDHDDRDGTGVDERVPRSNPLQLISTLNRVLNEAPDPIRKSA